MLHRSQVVQEVLYLNSPILFIKLQNWSFSSLYKYLEQVETVLEPICVSMCLDAHKTTTIKFGQA